jgi:DNA-binding Lrp family transcriptional regulator
MMLDAAPLGLIDRWQRNFPLVDRPFAAIARDAALGERETIRIFRDLQMQGVISRIGAIVRPNTIGASTLAAMRVPADELDAVAAIVSAAPLVTHNYERSHALNLWFVIAGPDLASVDATTEAIQSQTGREVLSLPMLNAYHLDLGFSLTEATSAAREMPGPMDYHPDTADRRLLAAIEDGLPLVEEPYHVVADQLGMNVADVLERLRALIVKGVVTRFGCVLHHRKLGYAANAMAVWDIDDARVGALAETFIRNPKVTLCYRRRRQRPLWPYNLFCMIHSKSQPEALAVVDELNRVGEAGDCAQAVLFSLRKFKQRGAVFSNRRALQCA